jgi:hypothetical protein
MNPEALLLVSVLTYLTTRNGDFTDRPIKSTNLLVRRIASAAAGILATTLHGTRFLDEAITPQGVMTLQHWSAGLIEPNEFAHPQLIASILLWADTWKNGS